MKKIYLVFTFTGTVLSRLIHCYTKEKYAHVSLSLDENLNEMYSFGRIWPRNPFWGGFVHEKPNCGIYKICPNTEAFIGSLKISDEQYEKLKKVIAEFESKKGRYRFNTIGLFAVVIKKKVKRKNYFYCAEFVKYVLSNANITNELPDLIKPMDFLDMKGLDIIYEGKLNEYKK